MTSRTSVLRLAAVLHPERHEALHLVLEEEDDNDGLLVVAEAERPQALREAGGVVGLPGHGTHRTQLPQK